MKLQHIEMRLHKLFYTIIIAAILGILLYSRFVGLNWGLPYPMHPDERNMVISILQMKCDTAVLSECFNPNFFAYGQLPLYAGLFLSLVLQSLQPDVQILQYESVTLALRIISAAASVVMVFFLYRIVRKIYKLRPFQTYIVLFILTFIPAFIQFAHFGTTESLLMMFVSILVYYSVQLIQDDISLSRYVRIAGISLGLAFSTKVSAGLFACIPFFALTVWFLQNRTWGNFGKAWFSLIKTAAFSIIFFIITSPFNIIDWDGFIHSMNYESAVGLGTYRAFYTRQFEHTLPFIFQFVKIFPYSLGWPIFILSILGFFLLPWNRTNNLIRFTAVVLFIPNAVMYAKWTRFIAPVFPLMVLFAVLFLCNIREVLAHSMLKSQRLLRNVLLFIVAMTSIVPGYAYLSIYQNPDVRFIASKWIYEHIQSYSYILAETANVVDVPIPNNLVIPEVAYASNLHPISFDFYELDNNEEIASELKNHIYSSNYIFVPSRRIFWNHTCYIPIETGTMLKHQYSFLQGYSPDRCEKLQKEYPLLKAYYDKLFDGSYEFEQVAEFTSYPKIEFFGKTLIEFPDEAAEETWTVFDHPVVRIYQRKNE